MCLWNIIIEANEFFLVVKGWLWIFWCVQWQQPSHGPLPSSTGKKRALRREGNRGKFLPVCVVHMYKCVCATIVTQVFCSLYSRYNLNSELNSLYKQKKNSSTRIYVRGVVYYIFKITTNNLNVTQLLCTSLRHSLFHLLEYRSWFAVLTALKA